MRGKILNKIQGGATLKIKVRYLVVIIGLIAGVGWTRSVARADSCPEVRVVFARGSGGERWNDNNYIAYRDAIQSKLDTTTIQYEMIDLDYPAIGIDDIKVLVGAAVGAGDAYEFGESVNIGVQNLITMVNDATCPGTKYVIGGYSQGAMVLSKALPSLKAERLIYAATFGDPKIYLPEGEGLMPAACRGDNLSDYRMYVPDCRAYKGLLGAYIPYEPEDLIGKVGVWCNKADIFCSSHLNIGNHVSYISDGLYEDASKVVFDKICKAFGVENTISSPHDTAIMIDSTGSMSGLINQYKDEAQRLAEETLAKGGRVALYDYRDFQEGYQAQQRCSFTSCTVETFRDGLNAIRPDGGGDTPESLLASSLQVMQELEWKQGSTKSIVVLTDAGYHEPDYDIGGTTKLDVVRLSKQIDPVNFYVITTAGLVDTYADLTQETGGRVATTAEDLGLLTDYIMERYDSLPRVEESEAGSEEEVPTLTIDKITASDDAAEISFSASRTRVLAVLNDAVLGIVDGGSLVINGLDMSVDNRLTMIPLGEDVRGDGVEVTLNVVADGFGSAGGASMIEKKTAQPTLPLAPKAPNTGKR